LGINVLDRYLDLLYFYYKEFGQEAESSSVIGAHKLLVPVIGSFMHCAENGKFLKSFLSQRHRAYSNSNEKCRFDQEAVVCSYLNQSDNDENKCLPH